MNSVCVAVLDIFLMLCSIFFFFLQIDVCAYFSVGTFLLEIVLSYSKLIAAKLSGCCVCLYAYVHITELQLIYPQTAKQMLLDLISHSLFLIVGFVGYSTSSFPLQTPATTSVQILTAPPQCHCPLRTNLRIVS